MIEQAIELWKDLIRLHNELLVVTVNEYQALIAQNIVKIEELTGYKEKLLRRIMEVEDRRVALIKNLQTPIQSIHDLADLWKKDKRAMDLIKYNRLLKDVVSKLKMQNIKNQLFYHKLIKSLSALKREFRNNPYQIYDKKGLTME
jgi:hypothetical protein